MKMRRIFLHAILVWMVVTVVVGVYFEAVVVYHAVKIVAGEGSDSGTKIFFPDVSINGRAAHLVLDSGWHEGGVLTEEGVQRLDVQSTPLPPTFPKVDGKTGAFSESIRLRVGAEEFNTQLPVIALGDEKIDGIIGWPYIQDNKILLFDSTRRMVSSLEKLPVETSTWLKLKVPVDKELMIETPLAEGRNGKILVDTGENFGVVLPSAQWKTWRAAHQQAPSTRRTYYMPGAGNLTVDEAWADEIKIGVLTLTDVPVREANALEASSVDNYAGSLGIYALSRIDLVVDGEKALSHFGPLL